MTNLKFAANLSMLYSEHPFFERFAQASIDGFNFVEYLFPYDWPANTLVQLLGDNQLQQVLFNLPAGDWQKGERGIACLPDRKQEFRQGVEMAIEFAQALKVNQVNCLAGIKPSELSNKQAWETLIENLSFAAERLAAHQIKLLLEPINSRVDIPGFFMDDLGKAMQTLNEVRSDNLQIQFDFYHVQIMHGDLLRCLESVFEHVGHIQFADNPGRHEPGTGEINYESIFRKLQELQYTGWVSAEYVPSQATSETLGWRV